MTKDQILSAIDGGSLQPDFYSEMSKLESSQEIDDCVTSFTEVLIHLAEEEIIGGTSDALLDGKLDPECLGDIYLW